MRWAFISSLVHVHLHSTVGIDREPFVWIDGNTKEARIGVNQLIFVSADRIPQDAGIPKVG